MAPRDAGTEVGPASRAGPEDVPLGSGHLPGLRVAGTDPGTSSLDVAVLHDGTLVDQHRFAPDVLRGDPAAPVRWLEQRGPFALVAGPSGYGLPLVRAAECGDEQRRLMSLVRADEAGGGGVAGFSAVVEAFCRSSLPVLFLPGVVHLASVPAHRKLNRIDLGTADKLCVAALALALRSRETGRPFEDCSFCLVEMGSAFTACVVLSRGRVVDGLGGTSGPVGWGSGGAWDGELAYLLSPLDKRDLFHGGVGAALDQPTARRAFREGLVKAVAGLLAVTACDEIVLSGRLLQREPELSAAVEADLARLARVVTVGDLPGAWVKHAAQGAALLADGLAGGSWAGLFRALDLGGAAGTALDGVIHPGRERVRLG
jgi:predicted butyrate kinase (DUF1464 family)